MSDLPLGPQPQLAVGAMVVREDRLLLIQRGHPPETGKWTVPGGRVRFGERLEEAVRREVYEECGLQVEPVRIAWIGERIHRDPDGTPRLHFVIIDYLCRLAEGADGVPRARDDARDAGWFTHDEMTALPLTDGLLDALSEAGIGPGQAPPR